MLDQIQLADGVSRVEIAQHTGLTPQTVSGIVRRLIDEGIVREDGARTSNGGKPRTVLRLNADAGRAVGLHFDPVELAAVVVDLLGRPLVTARRTTPRPADPALVTAAMAELVDEVLLEAGVQRSQVLGLGLAAPGPIDQHVGMVISPPQLANWSRVPIKEMLATATGLEVTLDNDATAAAVAERWAGAGRGVANFAYFHLGTGVGGGLVLGHQVYRGGSMNAAEFGHTSVAEDGPGCYCGNRGCLESLVNPPAIVAAAHRLLAADPPASSLSELYRADPVAVDHPTICLAAAAGDPLAAAVIDAAAEHLATVVVNVVNIVDVDLVILGGHGIRHVEARFRQAVVRALATRTLARRIRIVDVALSPLGVDAAVVGGAALVLHATFSPQVSSLLSE
ncbi:ROK family transcriptional regulator [Dactylosporangium siamense]|uniref:Transcriptional regulator n=1 Tax=Dactylosporangium siamense TaxID=685454 RepID=A0A919PFD8_9ACTN|nr:ROK family transcriptional regulator [Dactylosporangium siamense]GIG42377.1 transcriptional regulator [Dactylosporangium siamense]